VRKVLASKIVWLSLLVVVLGATVGGMISLRQSVLSRSAGESEMAAWQEWRRAAASEGGPVARRAPKSLEPPILVLLRDHFAICLAGMLFFEGSLILFLMFIVRGVLGLGS